MSKKLIPNGDAEFEEMAMHFAATVLRDPGSYYLPVEDAEQLGQAVERYRHALQAARIGERMTSKTRAKDMAKEEARAIIQRIISVVRADSRIDPVARELLGVRLRGERVKRRTCPQEPPVLKFIRALHEANGASPRHELKFRGKDNKTKPLGAVRLELFVDLVPPDEDIPAYPGANAGGRPWYLRSYTRSPIIVVPPIARVPMRVVYWGRWADSTGQVGPFSATAVGWIEGGSHAMLPGGIGIGTLASRGQCEQPKHTEPASLPAGRDEKYNIAVLEAHYASFRLAQMPALPEGEPSKQLEVQETKQLQGPAEAA